MDDEDGVPSTGYLGPPLGLGASLGLPLVVLYDNSFLATRGWRTRGAEAWLTRLLQLTQGHLAALGPYSVKLDILRIRHLDQRLKTRDFRKFSKKRSNKHERTAVLVGRKLQGLTGVTSQGGACRQDGQALVIFAERETLMRTAQSLTQQRGHTLGMR